MLQTHKPALSAFHVGTILDLPPASTTCTDLGWTDSDGDLCFTYSWFEWCHSGRPLKSGSSFDRYSNAGHTAMTACCDCGGGSGSTTTTTTTTTLVSTTCTDLGWTDSDGD